MFLYRSRLQCCLHPFILRDLSYVNQSSLHVVKPNAVLLSFSNTYNSFVRLSLQGHVVYINLRVFTLCLRVIRLCAMQGCEHVFVLWRSVYSCCRFVEPSRYRLLNLCILMTSALDFIVEHKILLLATSTPLISNSY